MIERHVGLEIDTAYAELKEVLARKGCKIISEKLPTKILVKQGSLWGASPKTAKKTVEFDLSMFDSETKVTCYSHLSSDWKNLALIGSAFAAVLVGLCFWISIDLNTFVITLKPTFWSWIITVNGSIDFQVAQDFVNLTRALAVFLSFTIVLEIAIIIYAHAKIDRFAEETLNSLSSYAGF